MTNKEYIIGFQNNDQCVITTFYEKFEKGFKRNLMLKHSIRDEDLLADIYQETVIRLWETIQRGRIVQANLTSDIAGYLYGIGKNVLREQFRKMKEQHLENLLRLPEDPTDYIFEFELTERNRAIRETVNNLDKPCAPLLLQFYWEGYSMDEIAINLGYSNANSAKTQKNKCMNKLKALLKVS